MANKVRKLARDLRPFIDRRLNRFAFPSPSHPHRPPKLVGQVCSDYPGAAESNGRAKPRRSHALQLRL